LLPFNQIGDKRLAYGVLTGMYQNMPFTMFDFHRRPKVTHVVTRYTKKEVNQLDTITVDSVWAITLPVAMPNFQIASSVESTFDVETCPEPATHDPKFNRWYKLISTDPNLAVPDPDAAGDGHHAETQAAQLVAGRQRAPLRRAPVHPDEAGRCR